MLRKVPFFLLFKVVVSLSKSLTSVLQKWNSLFTEIFCLIAWTLGWFSDFLIVVSTGFIKFSVSLRKYHCGSTLSDLTASSKKVLNSSDKSKLSDIVRLFLHANLGENCVFIRQKWPHRFQKFCTVSYLRTHNIFFFPFCRTYYKSFYGFCIVWGRFEFYFWDILSQAETYEGRDIFSSWRARFHMLSLKCAMTVYLKHMAWKHMACHNQS